MTCHQARQLAAVLLAGVAWAATGCSAGHTATIPPSATPPGVVRLATTGAPASLDFTTTSGAAIPQALMGNVYETLVRIDSSGAPQPLLAESWSVSEDGTRYTFRLREGVRFSNGDEFTAATAKFSIDRVRSSAWTNGLKAHMDPVAETTAIDPHTLEVRLARRDNGWLWTMGTLTGAMMTPNGVDDLATTAVGTGPYRVVDWRVGRSLALEPNPAYWGDPPKNRGAVLRYLPDAVSSTNALRTGDVDLVWSMQSPELLDALSADARWNLDVGTTNSEFLLAMNNRRAPFDDVRVRRAILHAVDRRGVIDTVWEGFGVDTGGVPVPPTDPWSFVSDKYPFDPQRARDLIADAGYAPGDRELDVTIAVPSLPYAQAASELIYSQLRDVGFTVTLETLEFPAVWIEQVMNKADFDMSLIGHVEARDLETLFGDPDYYLGFDSQRTRDLFAAAATAPGEESTGLMREATQEIVDKAGAATLMHLPNIVVSAASVRGIEADIVTDSLPLAAMEVDR